MNPMISYPYTQPIIVFLCDIIVTESQSLHRVITLQSLHRSRYTRVVTVVRIVTHRSESIIDPSSSASWAIILRTYIAHQNTSTSSRTCNRELRTANSNREFCTKCIYWVYCNKYILLNILKCSFLSLSRHSPHIVETTNTENG